MGALLIGTGPKAMVQEQKGVTGPKESTYPREKNRS